MTYRLSIGGMFLSWQYAISTGKPLNPPLYMILEPYFLVLVAAAMILRYYSSYIGASAEARSMPVTVLAYSLHLALSPNLSPGYICRWNQEAVISCRPRISGNCDRLSSERILAIAHGYDEHISQFGWLLGNISFSLCLKMKREVCRMNRSLFSCDRPLEGSVCR